MWILRYWREILCRSFELWERHEALSVLVGLGIGAVAGILALVRVLQRGDFTVQSAIPIGLAVWFCVLVLVVTPMRIWKEKTDRIVRLTTKRLRVSEIDRTPSGNKGVWLGLKVENLSAENVDSCYGKVIEYRLLDKMGCEVLVPVPGLRYTWRSYVHGGAKTLTTIPGSHEGRPPSHEILDIAMTSGDERNIFLTPNVGGSSFPLPPGNYESIIEVGSETESFRQTQVRVLIRFEGGNSLSARVKEAT